MEPQADNTNTTEPVAPAAADQAAPEAASTPTTPAEPAAPTTPAPAVVSVTTPEPATPETPAPAGPAPSVSSATVSSGGSKFGNKRRMLFIGAVVALLVILGGGYAFAFYLPNTPDNIYKHGLSNTSKAYDKLSDYVTATDKQDYKGAKVSGTMTIDAGGVSGDGSFEFQNKGGNGTGSVKLDIVGEKLSANVRSVQPAGQSDPDLYLQVSGIKSVLDKYGLTSFDSLDNQWIEVDHTLLKTAASSVAQGNDANVSAPTTAQVEDAINKVGAVNNTYIFKADKSHAVLQEKKYLGKSTFNGRSVYGYQVGYDSDHLQAYVQAVGAALDSSKLNDWSKAANSGKSISAVLQFSDLKDSIKSADKNYTFNMYVDAKTKLIANLHFAGSKASDYFEIGQTYAGGDVYPFVLKVASEDGTSGKMSLLLNLGLNVKTNEVNLDASFQGNSDGTTTKVGLKVKATPSNEAVNVTAPAGAKSVNDIISQLGFGGDASSSLLDQSALDNSASNGSDLFTLTQ